jgi:hypothetical protein
VWALQGAVSAGLTEIRERTAKRAGQGRAKDRAGKKKKK